MEVQSLFQLLNPLAFLLFAGGFFDVYFANRSIRAARMLGICYAVGAVAFIFDFFRTPMPPLVAGFGSNGLYTATAILFTSGVVMRYAAKPPLAPIGIATLVWASVYAWFFFGADDMWMRTYAVNLGNGTILAIGLMSIPRDAWRGFDRVILGVYALLTAQFFIRPFVIDFVSAGQMTMETYTRSLFFLSFHLIVGVFAIAMAMSLLMAFSMDIIADLNRRSVTDALSGVFNRRGFEEDARALFERVDAEGGAASIILADIDRFKAINDSYGHALGDKVIAQMGALLRGYSNAGRIAGRMGGEEFALIIPGARLNDAADIAEAMRRKFATFAFASPDGVELRVTASFGVALRQPGEMLFDVLGRADEALYLAKEGGRDRVATEESVSVARLDGALERLERRQFRRSPPNRKSA